MGFTPLHLAAEGEHYEVFKFILEKCHKHKIEFKNWDWDFDLTGLVINMGSVPFYAPNSTKTCSRLEKIVKEFYTSDGERIEHVATKEEPAIFSKAVTFLKCIFGPSQVILGKKEAEEAEEAEKVFSKRQNQQTESIDLSETHVFRNIFSI